MQPSLGVARRIEGLPPWIVMQCQCARQTGGTRQHGQLGAAWCVFGYPRCPLILDFLSRVEISSLNWNLQHRSLGFNAGRVQAYDLIVEISDAFGMDSYNHCVT